MSKDRNEKRTPWKQMPYCQVVVDDYFAQENISQNRGCGEVAKSQRRRVSPEDLNHSDKGISIRKRNKPHKSWLHLEAEFCSFLPTGIFLISAKLDAKISSLSLADLARYQTFQLCM